MRTVIRIVLTIVMDALLLLAALLLARIVIEFFGQLSAVPIASQVARLADRALPSVGVGSIPTPFHGSFDSTAAVAMVVVLAVEWVVAKIRKAFK